MDFWLCHLVHAERLQDLNTQNNENVFSRSGLASLSDLQTEAWQNVFSFLEEKQSAFLSKASEFRSEDYKWPNDPLHCWSRIWEYPYVYYHLGRYVEGFTQGSRPVVADVGSGVTFFPLALAQLGCEVICTDIDPVCEKDISRACESVAHSPGKVHFRLVSSEKLPFEDGECDVVYCISVLEHIPDFENTVSEMARVLKPGGLCLITCDLDLSPAGDTQLNTAQYDRLSSVIEKDFGLLFPEKTIHPVDILTSLNSPYPERRSGCIRTGAQLIKQKVLKPILGRKPGRIGTLHLTVLGLALQKRS